MPLSDRAYVRSLSCAKAQLRAAEADTFTAPIEQDSFVSAGFWYLQQAHDCFLGLLLEELGSNIDIADLTQALLLQPERAVCDSFEGHSLPGLFIALQESPWYAEYCALIPQINKTPLSDFSRGGSEGEGAGFIARHKNHTLNVTSLNLCILGLESFIVQQLALMEEY